VKATHSNQDTQKVNKYNNLQAITMAKIPSLPHGMCERKEEPRHTVMHNLKKIRNQQLCRMRGR